MFRAVMARYCARKRVSPEDVGGVELNPGSKRADDMDVMPSLSSGWKRGRDEAQFAREDGVGALSTGAAGYTEDGAVASRRPLLRCLCLLLPFHRYRYHSLPRIPLDKNCVRMEAPGGTLGDGNQP